MPGVYISYPFCNQKCTFCNFASGVHKLDTQLRYHATLLAEIEAQQWPWQPETLYLGGGTPSLMPLEFLTKLLVSVKAGVARDHVAAPALAEATMAEVTMECAPGTVTPETAAAWRDAGVNRVSLGVQSFDLEELRHTGRRHTAQTVADDIAVLRRAGLLNINVDLIAGLPHQTRETWNRSLDCLARLDVPHASIYIFEIDEDSRLGQEILLGGKRYSAGFLPGDDLAADLYQTAVDRLRALGLARYEISNFARPGCESRHNLKYWQHEPYFGFGLDAHSFDNGLRWSNSDDLEEYLDSIPGGSNEREPTNAAEEHFFVGLRLMNGIRPTADEWQAFAEPITKWKAAGMLQQQGDILRLTEAGVLVSNEIFQEFIDV